MISFGRNCCTFIYSARNAFIEVLGQKAMMPVALVAVSIVVI